MKYVVFALVGILCGSCESLTEGQRKRVREGVVRAAQAVKEQKLGNLKVPKKRKVWR